MKPALLLFALLFFFGCTQYSSSGLVTLGSSDWCQPGGSWKWPGAYPADSTFQVEGLVSFQDRAYCLAVYQDENAPEEVQYLFLQENADVWRLVVSEDGNVLETHVTAGGINWYG